MNIRGQKQYIMAKMAYNMMWQYDNNGVGNSYYAQHDVGVSHNSVQSALEKRIAEEALHAVEEAKQEFVCSKVKDGTVVATFDNLSEAKALVVKHIRGKKAKLQVMDSSTGELIAFEEEGV